MTVRRAAFFDVDGTLTQVRTWAGIINYFRQRGEKRLTYARFWLYHSILYLLFKIGLVSQVGYREPWAANLGWFLKGLYMEEAQALWDWVVTIYFGPNWHSHSLDILKQHKEQGDLIVLISASPAPLVQRVAEELGADVAVATEFEVREGRFTGKTSDEVCIAERKAVHAKRKLEELGIEVDFENSASYADSSGDLSMLEMVGRPVALNADEVLLPIARERGWEIISSR